MSSIELIIKDCREHLKLYGEAFITEEEIDLIEKRIKELEEENKILLNSKVGIDLSYDDYIPVQKVKKKIEEVHNMKFEDERLNSATIDFAVHKFEELLEDK